MEEYRRKYGDGHTSGQKTNPTEMKMETTSLQNISSFQSPVTSNHMPKLTEMKMETSSLQNISRFQSPVTSNLMPKPPEMKMEITSLQNISRFQSPVTSNLMPKPPEMKMETTSLQNISRFQSPKDSRMPHQIAAQVSEAKAARFPVPAPIHPTPSPSKMQKPTITPRSQPGKSENVGSKIQRLHEDIQNDGQQLQKGPGINNLKQMFENS